MRIVVGGYGDGRKDDMYSFHSGCGFIAECMYG